MSLYSQIKLEKSVCEYRFVFSPSSSFSQGDQGPIGPTGPRGAPGIGITGPKVRQKVFLSETETKLLIVTDVQLILSLIACKLLCIFYHINMKHSWLVNHFESERLSASQL